MLEVKLNNIFDLAGNYSSSLASNTKVELKVDEDGDGVKMNLISVLAHPEKVDASGALDQFDADNDGIPDYLDRVQYAR